MKMTFCLLLAAFMQVSAGVNAQQITITENNASLKKIFRQIEKQSDYFFVYRNEWLQQAKKVDIDLKNASIRQVMDACLKGLPLSYSIINKTVIITLKPEVRPKAAKPDSLPGIVSGQVMDVNGQPLVGVTITDSKRGTHALTDELGVFKIAGGEGDTLHFTMIGMRTKTVAIKKASRILKVTLEQNVSKMNEVVVVGYGKQKKISVTGAISTIDVEDLKTPNRSLANSFGGKVAGVISQQQRGEPGYDEPTFTIRGISTFTGNTSPLVLVDGVERDNYAGAYSNIDPEDIESISFLKDASATAVYGARGANGVILITTKRGIAGKPRVSAKFETGTSGLTQMPRFVDGATWMSLYNEAIGQQQYSADQIEKVRSHVDPYLYPDVNWMKAIYKKWSPPGYNVNVNVTGGGSLARYYVSASFFDEEGNYRVNTDNPYNSNVGFKRYNFRSNVDMNITKTTLLSLSINAMLVNGNYPGISAQTIWNDAYQQPPILFPIQYPDGKWAGPVTNQGVNPLSELQNDGYSREFKPTIQSVFSLNQKLDMVTPGLSVTGRFSFDTYSETDLRRTRSIDTWLANGRDTTGKLIYVQTNYGDEFLGFSSSTYDVTRSMYFEGDINYDRIFGKYHHVGGLLLYNMRERINGSAGDAISGIPYRNQGLAARATYSYKDKYLLEFDAGYTGSENFEKGHRFGLFPSVSAGWVISNERFFSKLQRTISLLKIRGSVGKVGNDQIGQGGRFPYLSAYSNGSGVDFGPTQNWYQGITESSIGVEGLSWEISTKSDIGIDLELFDKLDITVDGFTERRKDILIQRGSLSGLLGATAPVYANLGIMSNKGIDGSIDYKGKIGRLNINLYGNFTFAQNKYIQDDEPTPLYPWLSNIGTMYGQVRGLVAEGLFKDQDDIDKSPAQQFGTVRPGDIKYKDINHDGVINSYDEIPIGGTDIPQVMYGAGFKLEYHGFHLEAFFQGTAKVDFMLSGRGIVPFSGGLTAGNLLTAVTDHWSEENPSQDVLWPRLSIASAADNNYQPSTWWLRSGSFVRLKDAQVGYSFRPVIIKELGLQVLYVYLSGENILTFSKFKLWDPGLGGGNGAGYPPVRTINFGIKADF